MPCITHKDLYLPNGYVDITGIIKKCPRTFIFMIGARGIGKTYGAVDFTLDVCGKSIYMRRMQSQCDFISTVEMSHVKKNFSDRGLYYGINRISNGVYGVYHADKDDEGKIIPYGEPIMLNCALSTMHNIRGYDASDIDYWFYDEFIPEPNERPIRNEGEAFLNSYETLNRNRELQGRNPMKVICMANSNNLDNALFADLNLINACDKIFSTGKCIYDNPKRDLCVINFTNSPISEQKSDTALYRLSKGMDFSDMALSNKFRNYKSPSKSFDLKRLIPVINVGELTVYRVKGSDDIAISMHEIKAPTVYENTEKGLKRFLFDKWANTLWMLYLNNKLVFENYHCEYLFKKYCNQL